jgi:hypothetical protein
MHSELDFIKIGKKIRTFFLGLYIHFQFREIVKFNEESESGEKKMKNIGFRA